jgi:hypothetical protein
MIVSMTTAVVALMKFKFSFSAKYLQVSKLRDPKSLQTSQMHFLHRPEEIMSTGTEKLFRW